MKVLILSNDDIKDADAMPDYLRECGDEPMRYNRKISLDFLRENKIDFIVSDRHRHLIKEPILSQYDGRIVNLHPSFLPWCRGYYPNIWSFVDQTPQGVTIHYIDEGIDTGDIIVQRKLFFDDNDTLRTSYDKCKQVLDQLFREHWISIRECKCPRTKQPKEGTLHYEKHFKKISHLLTKGWDTPIGELPKLLEGVSYE